MRGFFTRAMKGPKAVVPVVVTGDDPLWSAIYSAAGVFMYDTLQTQAKLTAYLVNDATADHVSIDTGVKPSSYETASFKFAVLNADGPASGSICVPFGRTFTQGDTVWFSYLVYAPWQFVYQPWSIGDGPGHKFSIMSRDANGAAPTGSNQNNEVVMQGTQNRGVIAGYHQGAGSYPSEDVGPLVTQCSGSDYKWQGQINQYLTALTGNDPETGIAWSTCAQDRRKFGGLYSQRTLAQDARGYGDPLCGAFRQWPSQQIRITVRTIIGTWNTASSRITAWAAKYQQPYVLLYDSKNVTVGGGSPPDYNALTLLPYTTNRSGGGRKVSSSNALFNAAVSVLNLGVGTHLGTATVKYDATTGAFYLQTAADSYGTARYFSNANGVTIINLKSSSDGVATTLNGAVTLPQATIALTSTTGFPAAGTVVIGTPDTTNGSVPSSHGNGEQRVQYTGVSGNNLTGCTGGTGIHDTASPAVISSYIQLQLVTPASLPGSGTANTATFTVADGRPDTQVNYARVCGSTAMIRAEGGYPAVDSDGTLLSQKAATMASGDWAQMSPTPSGLVSTFCGGINSNVRTTFAQKMAYDPVGKVIYFIGTDHADDAHFCQYDETTNACSLNSNVAPWDYTYPPVNHAYDHTTFDTLRSKLYYRPPNVNSLYRWNGGTSWSGPFSWASLVSYAGPAFSIEYNPAIDRILVYQDANGSKGGMVSFNPATDTFSVIEDGSGLTLDPTGEPHVFGWYQPTGQLHVFGGGGPDNGGQAVYKRDAAGTITKLTAIPGALNKIGPASNYSRIFPNPSNGKFIVIYDATTWYDLDPAGAGTWTVKGGTVSMLTSNTIGGGYTSASSVVGVPLYAYGVILFVKAYSLTGCEMWLYKP